MTVAGRTGARHGFAVLALAFLALTAFGSAVSVEPLELDNVVSLSYADRSAPLHFFTHSVAWTYSDTHGTAPIYRPLTYLTIWVQEQVGGLHGTQYFVVNLLVWIAAALALYALVYLLTRSRLAALVVAGAFAVDGRALSAVVWVGERQSTMACLFGLLALLAVRLWGDTARRNALAVGVAGLLLLAALSKEYGLAFLVAVPFLAAASGRRHWKAVTAGALGALGAYLVLRFGVAGGATGSYCEDMGLYKHAHRVCYSQLGFGGRMKQYGYNILASSIGTVFPQFFNLIGVVTRSPPLLRRPSS